MANVNEDDKLINLVAMNGTSSSLNLSAKVEGFQGFAFFNGNMPFTNENSGRLVLLTNDKANVDWREEEKYVSRQHEPLLDYDDEARKLFKQLNLPDPLDENTKN